MENERAKLAEKKKISDDLRTSSENSDPIPLDIIQEIFKGLPIKTLTRFLCVSKEFASIIRNQDFMKSYLIKPSTSPQSLIFTFESKSRETNFFFSSVQPQNPGESSSSVATYLMKCHSRPYKTISPSVHGLICYGLPSQLMVYNPSTRRSITLPKIDSQRIDMYHFLGYDPINGDYKVLCMVKGPHIHKRCDLAQELRVLTLGKENFWRMIEEFPPHFLDVSDCLDICIDGVLYYEAFLDKYDNCAVMSFDVRSEKFDLIKIPKNVRFTRLTRYEGKLAIIITSSSKVIGISTSICTIYLWVLVDAATHEWLKKEFVVDHWRIEKNLQAFCSTDTGELVLAEASFETTGYVLYYDPRKISVRRVYIERIIDLKLWDKDQDRGIVSIFPGQVENLMFL